VAHVSETSEHTGVGPLQRPCMRIGSAFAKEMNMKKQHEMDRRNLLKYTAASAGLVAVPATLAWLSGENAVAAPAVPAATPTSTGTALPFVDDYASNAMANLSPETNAAVRILSGMQQLWHTGTAWNTGTVLAPKTMRANMRYVAEVTRNRTDAEARLAFIVDRRHQSYSVIDGLGPLADLYKSGAKAVTTITSAPAGTPAGKIDDAVPADAPAGSANGAGATDSDLGLVVQLVNALRGPHASGNPSKYTYLYPRPWRMTEDSTVSDTGTLDAFGFPIYNCDVIVAPQLLRQRSTSPADDCGYVSGHTNALYLAALALAYAIPERFQELVTCASAYGHTRIVAGMHSPVDVIGGRTLATALAAATLVDPAFAQLKAAARNQATAYFAAKTGASADDLFAVAHSGDLAEDPYADHEANAAKVTQQLTYILPRGGRHLEMTVPKGAEVLLETRLPYLDAAQRREVLRTTALPSGYVLLDGPELWGRLNLFAAADGYGALSADVVVDMDAADGGFSAADTWRNDMDGDGALVKRGTGALTLTGANHYSGGTRVEAGVLVAGSSKALGEGDVQVVGGTLRLAQLIGGVRVQGDYTQSTGTVLEVTLHRNGKPVLSIEDSASLGKGCRLQIDLDPAHLPVIGEILPVIRAKKLHGKFAAVTVQVDGYRAVPVYAADGLSIRLLAG
jgi:autotransporter-associated beta strand protein